MTKMLDAAKAMIKGEALKVNFLKPVWNAPLIATGRVVKQGRTVGMAECDVTDEKGSLVARATSTCMTLRGEHAQGR